MLQPRSYVALCALFVASFNAVLRAQQASEAVQQSTSCTMPSFSKVVNEPNFFNEQQEIWLGNILDEQVLKQYNVVEDPERDYLQKMGERMLAQLPPTSRHYEFYIIDYPINNAFSLGGSKIYVTRQLIAFLKNEDELAGLLGHEIGHVVTHQIAIDVSRMLRKALNVTQVGDRNDIFQKWNQMQDVWAKKRASLHDFDREEDEQQIADRIGLYAMMRAGYQPLHLADFFDRLTENKGKTGNFLTDFFGTTNPNSKRVRLLINKAAPLPSGCVSSLGSNSASHFLDWQKAVIGAGRAVAREKVEGVVRKAELKPPLRGSLEYLQFSPDGRFILAQDESSVFVLSHQPLTTLFRIDAVNAEWAQFSPDSHSVVVADAELRVQKWDIESRQRTSVTAVSLAGRCLDYAVSSTGDALACMKRRKDDLQLDLIDVNSGTVFFSKAINWPQQILSFMVLDQRQTFRFNGPAHIHLQFSPDSHYFLAGTADNAIGYDLQAKHELNLPGRIRQMASSSFTFTANNDLAAYNSEKPSRSQLAHFPSGDLVLEFPLEINGFKLQGRLIAPAAGGRYILVTPAAMHPIAAIDVDLKKLAMGYKSPGLAIYGDFIAGEQLGGRVALFSLAEQKQLASTQLPLSYLPSLRASGFSPDGKWLAAAGETSGGIWNTESGERVMDTGTFYGGYFDEGKVLATFHKSQAVPKMVSLDPLQKTQVELFDIGGDSAKKNREEDKERIWQAGDLVFSAMPPAKGRTTIAAHDARNYQVRWTRDFPGVLPTMTYSRSGKTLTAVFQFFQAAKDESKMDPDLKQKYEALPNKGDAILIEALDPATGKTRGSIFVDTANYSFFGNSAITAGDTVLLYDTHNRTLVYALSSGQQKGKVIGRFRAISATGDMMLVENEAGVAELYSTSTLQSLARYTFPARVTHAEFIASGNLLVLAADQTLYEINVTQEKQSASNK